MKIAIVALGASYTQYTDAVAARETLKIVALTQVQYDALDPPNSNTLYFITDAGS